jgi:hypothetical protein
MPLIQLIYISHLVGEDETSLGPILSASVRRNTASGITGMLLYANGRFLQALEGEEAAVEETYARICRDVRHEEPLLLSRETIAQRQFGNWSMGFRHMSEADARHLPRFAPWFRFGFEGADIAQANSVARDMLAFFSETMA